jgi:1A family penicillin-binding protein
MHPDIRSRLLAIRKSVGERWYQLVAAWHLVRQRHPRLVLGLAGGLAVAAAVTAVIGILFLIDLRRDLPDHEAVRRMGEMDQATAVFDGSDKVAFTIFKEQRIEVPLSKISPHLIRALVAVEDQRFFDHRGFDTFRMVSAALANVRLGRMAQGGSTITQQLARQSFLKPERTLRRKLQELILAQRIERVYPKWQILELYLNKVYFGDGLYGAEAASRGYFGKSAVELTVSEGATLAGLVKSPSTYAPTVSLERAVARRNVVLQAMFDTGVIDLPTLQQARATEVVLTNSLEADEPHGQYFKEQVRLELVARFGWQRVHQGGLRVFSTIDMAMQGMAEEAVQEGLKAVTEKRRTNAARRGDAVETDQEPLQAALVALDPRTGHVLAMIGGRNFAESRFNRAVQAHRQPGSAFKPFVYATALEAGYTPATVLDHLDEPIDTLEGAWTPEEGHSMDPTMSLRTALRTSSNRAAVRLLQQVGISRTVEYAKNMGVGDVPSVPSLALGSGEVTLNAMTAAYAAFANRGLVPTPMLIRRVEDRQGQVLFQAEPSTKRAISEVTAFLMSNMLADVINAGTAARVRSLGFTLPAAGKTGTTNEFNDAWFVGFTPTLTTGVWVGFDRPRTILRNGFAADVAVPMWAKFMKAATAGQPASWFSPPPGVTTASVCRVSGRLATSECDHAEVIDETGKRSRRQMVYTEYFAKGTEPTSYCDVHTLGVFRKIATFFGATPAPRSPTPVASAPEPAAVRVEPPPVVEPPPPEPPKAKRGFWSKVFGIKRGDKDERRDDKKNDPVNDPGDLKKKRD